jgi:tRNA 2-thiouridine synthesizing protein A
MPRAPPPASSEAIMQIDKELDARGLNCPLPILRTKKALTDMASGQVLRILATDPGSVKDFQAFARQTGNTLLSSETANDEFVFLLQKK